MGTYEMGLEYIRGLDVDYLVFLVHNGAVRLVKGLYCLQAPHPIRDYGTGFFKALVVPVVLLEEAGPTLRLDLSFSLSFRNEEHMKKFLEENNIDNAIILHHGEERSLRCCNWELKIFSYPQKYKIDPFELVIFSYSKFELE